MKTHQHQQAPDRPRKAAVIFDKKFSLAFCDFARAKEKYFGAKAANLGTFPPETLEQWYQSTGNAKLGRLWKTVQRLGPLG